VPGRLAEVLTVSAVASVITVAMASAVLRAPSERIFGIDIVGRHHDPFTVMQQFERPISIGIYSQPVTDITGALLSRVSGPVAAYNWLILFTFPLAAATAYLLARHLALSRPAATVAALAFLPAFQVALYLALWVAAAFAVVEWKRFAAGLALLGFTQSAGLLLLQTLAIHAGLTAHVRDVRGWAVAGPILIFAAVVTSARTPR